MSVCPDKVSLRMEAIHKSVATLKSVSKLTADMIRASVQEYEALLGGGSADKLLTLASALETVSSIEWPEVQILGGGDE